MRSLSLNHQTLLIFERIPLDFTFGQEWYIELSPIEVESMFDQVDAALVPLEVVKAEQEIYLVVFEDGE